MLQAMSFLYLVADDWMTEDCSSVIHGVVRFFPLNYGAMTQLLIDPQRPVLLDAVIAAALLAIPWPRAVHVTILSNILYPRCRTLSIKPVCLS